MDTYEIVDDFLVLKIDILGNVYKERYTIFGYNKLRII